MKFMTYLVKTYYIVQIKKNTLKVMRESRSSVDWRSPLERDPELLPNQFKMLKKLVVWAIL